MLIGLQVDKPSNHGRTGIAAPNDTLTALRCSLLPPRAITQQHSNDGDEHERRCNDDRHLVKGAIARPSWLLRGAVHWNETYLRLPANRLRIWSSVAVSARPAERWRPQDPVHHSPTSAPAAQAPSISAAPRTAIQDSEAQPAATRPARPGGYASRAAWGLRVPRGRGDASARGGGYASRAITRSIGTASPVRVSR